MKTIHGAGSQSLDVVPSILTLAESSSKNPVAILRFWGSSLYSMNFEGE